MVARLLALACVLALALSGCGGGSDEEVVLPEDPCDLLTAAEVAAATDSEVTKVERVASIDQIVAAQDRGGTANDVPVSDRHLCSFTTTSPLGAITAFVPESSGDVVETFRPANGGRVESIKGLGDEAYMASGSSLHVRIDRGIFSIQVQRPGRSEARPVLTKLSEAAIKRLRS